MSNNEKYVCVNCVEQISKKDTDIERLRQVVLFYSKENERLRELMLDLMENAKGGDDGEIIVDSDDFDAIEKEVSDE